MNAIVARRWNASRRAYIFINPMAASFELRSALQDDGRHSQTTMSAASGARERANNE
jgi:hypothetical protein